MFEHKSIPILPIRVFAKRQALHVAYGLTVLLTALALGTVGYKVCEERSWIDSVYSAAMILTGMGPAFEAKFNSTKLFASAYSIFSGVVFLTSASVMLAPGVHRFLHRLHLEEDNDEETEPARAMPAGPVRE